MQEQYYFLGAGGVGKRTLKHLMQLGIIKGIFDSNPLKHGESMFGLTVEPYNNNVAKEYGVIIGFFDSKKLECELKKDGIRYWTLTDFITDWFRKTQNKSGIAFLDIPITSRCTLNCKHCMQYIPYRISKSDVPLGGIKKRLDGLYNTIDYVLEASIIGGEPFLHPDLSELLYSIDREKIKSVVITTNGMVIPKDNVLKACAETDVFISISDYGKTLPHISDVIDAFERLVKSAGIRCERKNQVWIAPGKFESNCGEIGSCSRTHFQLSDDKLWYCSLQCGASISEVCSGEEKRDYIRLNMARGTDNKDILRFISKHTTSMCERCENKNQQNVLVAEQI